jgi:chromosome partitioning protein
MIIVVSSFKGGVAKTTTAIHLSAYLSQQKGANHVVLADGDLNIPTMTTPFSRWC